MCSCEPGFVCLRCAGTPFDDGYDDSRQVSEGEFASLTSEPYLYEAPEQVYAEEEGE